VMGKIIIHIEQENQFCKSGVQLNNAQINDLQAINSELDLIKMQILVEIQKQRESKKL